MKKVSVIGSGALGGCFAENLEKTLPNHYELAGIYGIIPEEVEELSKKVGCKAYKSIDELLLDKPDYVVEMAGAVAVKLYGEAVLNSGCDFILVSIGSLADDELYSNLRNTAEKNGKHLYIPNGAIGGFDLMRTMSLMGPLDAYILNEKAPSGLNGAPYLNGVDLPEDKEVVIFEGTAKEAIKGFPKNVNVAVATSLAAGEDTKVIIKSIPNLVENRHTIHLEGSGTTAEVSVFSLPDPNNPKSSTCTAWSVIALLESLAGPVHFF